MNRERYTSEKLVCACLLLAVCFSAIACEEQEASVTRPKLVFSSDRDGNSQLYVMNADGSNERRLTRNLAQDGLPSWSPDGERIAFVSNRDGNLEVYVMNADGTGQTRLTNEPASDQDPTWSPDGTKVAFWSLRDGLAEVYVMNANGTGQTNLTNHPLADNLPTWSPDGTKIAFESSRDGNVEIYVMNADGTGQTNLTNNPAHDLAPDWGVASGSLSTCAEGVSEARSRIAQLLPNRPILRFLLNFLLTRMQGGAPNAEGNFGAVLDALAQLGIITPQDATDLKALVAPC